MGYLDQDLTGEMVEEIMKQGKYQEGEKLYLAKRNGKIIGSGTIVQKLWDEDEKDNLFFIYSVEVTNNEEEYDEIIEHVLEKNVRDFDLYNNLDYVRKFKKKPAIAKG